MSVGEPAIVKLRAIALSTVCVIHRHNAPPNQLALKNVHLCWNEPPLIVLWGYRCVNFRSHQSFSMQLKRDIKGIHDSWKISWAVFFVKYFFNWKGHLYKCMHLLQCQNIRILLWKFDSHKKKGSKASKNWEALNANYWARMTKIAKQNIRTQLVIGRWDLVWNVAWGGMNESRSLTAHYACRSPSTHEINIKLLSCQTSNAPFVSKLCETRMRDSTWRENNWDYSSYQQSICRH